MNTDEYDELQAELADTNALVVRLKAENQDLRDRLESATNTIKGMLSVIDAEAQSRNFFTANR